MQLVGPLLLVDGSLAHVLDGQRGDDDERLLEGTVPLRLDEHAGQPRVDGEGDDGPAVGRDPLAGQVGRCIGVDGLQLGEQPHAVGHLAGVRRLEEGEPVDLPQPEVGHLQDDAGQVGPQDLGVGELRAGLEVLLAVEADRDAVGEPAAASRPLVGAGLADRLDRQPLDLEPLGVAADPGGAGVDDVADPGDGQRGLGHVGRDHDPAAGVPGEDPVLLGGREPPVEGQHLGAGQLHTLQRVGGVADLPLARAEDEDVLPRAVTARPLGPQLLDRLADAGDLVDLDEGGLALLGRRPLALERAVADLDRVGAPGDLDDRGGPTVGVGEVGGEPVDVDGRRRDDDLQVRPARQQLAQVAQDEVDVEAALVRLVDDERVVAAEHPVALQLGEQDAVGHHLQQGVLSRGVGEPDLVAHERPQLGAQLLADALGDRAGGDPPGLGVTDHPLDPAAQLEADLGQLGGLAGPGLAGDDDDLVVADQRLDLVATLADRQLGRVVERLGCRECGPAGGHGLLPSGMPLRPPVGTGTVGATGSSVPPWPPAMSASTPTSVRTVPLTCSLTHARTPVTLLAGGPSPVALLAGRPSLIAPLAGRLGRRRGGIGHALHSTSAGKPIP